MTKLLGPVSHLALVLMVLFCFVGLLCCGFVDVLLVLVSFNYHDLISKIKVFYGYSTGVDKI